MKGLTAVVAGASGLVGGLLVRRLLGDPAFGRVTLLVRKELPLGDPRLVQEVVDFASLGAASVAASDAVFCALGTTIGKAGSQEAFRKVDQGAVLSLARASSSAGARQFLVVSSLGADPKSMSFYSRVKGEMEHRLRGIPFEGTQVFRPSLLLGARGDFRLGERLAASVAAPVGFLLAGPLAKYRPIEADTVAAAMLRVARGAPAGFNVYESDEIRRLGTSLPR